MTSKVFVISLEASSHPRIAALFSVLSRMDFEPELVRGVLGRGLDAGTYFDRIQRFRLLRGHTMTPSELGCSMSHSEALRRLIASGSERALVLEDDVLLDSVSLARMRVLCRQSRYDDGLLLLGGQEGLEHLIDFVHGKLVDPDNEVWELFNGDLKLVHRTVGYQLSGATAESLLSLSLDCPFVVDDYEFVSRHSNISKFFLANCVGHPRDTSSSSIEAERAANRLGALEQSRPLKDRLITELTATVRGRKIERDYRRSTVGYDLVRWSSRF